MRRTGFAITLVGLVTLLGCASPPPAAPADLALLRAQVAATERAFAKTLADRDEQSFASFLADETVFFNGSTSIVGRAAVVAAWRPFFVETTAPFSWTPEQVEVLASGTLALSSGPVFDPGGKKFASFTSVWRLEAPGVWRIVFDRGCDCVAP
jgi:ketosteroid isomerase-like protein